MCRYGGLAVVSRAKCPRAAKQNGIFGNISGNIRK